LSTPKGNSIETGDKRRLLIRSEFIHGRRPRSRAKSALRRLRSPPVRTASVRFLFTSGGGRRRPLRRGKASVLCVASPRIPAERAPLIDGLFMMNRDGRARLRDRRQIPSVPGSRVPVRRATTLSRVIEIVAEALSGRITTTRPGSISIMLATLSGLIAIR
jgi:hypothetical protein